MNRLKTLAPLALILAVVLSCGLGDKAEQIKTMAENLEETATKLEAGDTTGAQNAFGKLLGGGEAVQPVDFRTLKELLPERLSGLERTNASGERNRMMGMGTSQAEGQYTTEDRQGRIDISITDMGSVRGLGMLGINWLMVEVDKETSQGYERTVKYEGYPALEKFEQGSDWSRGEMSVFVADRFIVSVKGNGVREATLKDALRRVDLRRLEAMKDEGVGEAAPEVPDVTDFMPNRSDSDAPGARDTEPQTTSNERQVEPVDFRELKTFLPEDLPGLVRANTEGEKGGMMGVKTSSATGTYQVEGNPSTRVTVKIIDAGTLQGGLMLGGYTWLMMEVDKESDQGYERTTTYKGHPAYEKFTSRGSSATGTMQAIVGGRFAIEVEGRGVEMDLVKAAMEQIDLERLVAMKDVGVAPAI